MRTYARIHDRAETSNHTTFLSHPSIGFPVEKKNNAYFQVSVSHMREPIKTITLPYTISGARSSLMPAVTSIQGLIKNRKKLKELFPSTMDNNFKAANRNTTPR
jgi:hypothetical protein